MHLKHYRTRDGANTVSLAPHQLTALRWFRNEAGFPLYAGVASRANERDKLERLCRYVALQGCRVLGRSRTIASAHDRVSAGLNMAIGRKTGN